jgi:hypothetical protein
MIKATCLLASLVLFNSCSCSKQKHSFETQEEARRLARENSEFNAQTYRVSNANVQGLRMVLRGDSSINEECPQGDGWATIDFIDDATNKTITVKCSTVSDTIGCVEKKDFDSRSYAKEDGACNDKIPFPLPKIKK